MFLILLIFFDSFLRDMPINRALYGLLGYKVRIQIIQKIYQTNRAALCELVCERAGEKVYSASVRRPARKVNTCCT